MPSEAERIAAAGGVKDGGFGTRKMTRFRIARMQAGLTSMLHVSKATGIGTFRIRAIEILLVPPTPLEIAKLAECLQKTIPEVRDLLGLPADAAEGTHKP